MEIENIVSVVEEEKGIRVHTAEGCEFFAPYENVLYYSKSAERQLDESSQITINGSLSEDDIEELKQYGVLEIKKPS